MQLPPELIESVASKRLVPFVGAGVSRSVLKKDRSPAFPPWDELLRRGAEELDRVGKTKVATAVKAQIDLLADPDAGQSPIQIGDMIRKTLQDDRWVKFLENQLAPRFQDIDGATLELPKQIWNLASNFVITTNFDKILNWTCPQSGDVKILDLENYAGLASTLSDKLTRPTIWHLHGHIDNPGKLILTSDNYAQLYGAEQNDSHSSAALHTLNSVFTSKTMLFVGFSFDDEYVRKQLESLARRFASYNGRHFALVRKAELAKAKPLLRPLQVEAIVYEDFGEPLVELVRTIAEDAGGTPPSARNGNGHHEPELKEDLCDEANPLPMPANDRWRATQAVRLLDQIGPAYILDRYYFFQDWNAAFQRLFADPLGLYRGQHAQEFVRSLANRGVVEARARQVFQPGNLPLVDMEPLVFQSKEFGIIELWKIASRILDDAGQLAGWSIVLNITGAERLDALWEELKSTLDARINWALYSRSYDKLVRNFDEYPKLTELVCSKLGGAVQCADFGAGTGNGTIELLNQQPERTVWAIEPLEEMLTQLRGKIDAAGVGDRVHFIKQGIRSLGEFEDGYFDGAIMINVLYAVDDPAAALKEVARVMQPEGVLALSTTHSKTDIDRLFKAISDNLRGKGLLSKFRGTLKETRERHERMIRKICRDDKADIRRYLEEAGFRIEEWLDDQYAGAVVVVKAVKR